MEYPIISLSFCDTILRRSWKRHNYHHNAKTKTSLLGIDMGHKTIEPQLPAPQFKQKLYCSDFMVCRGNLLWNQMCIDSELFNSKYMSHILIIDYLEYLQTRLF